MKAQRFRLQAGGSLGPRMNVMPQVSGSPHLPISKVQRSPHQQVLPAHRRPWWSVSLASSLKPALTAAVLTNLFQEGAQCKQVEKIPGIKYENVRAGGKPVHYLTTQAPGHLGPSLNTQDNQDTQRVQLTQTYEVRKANRSIIQTGSS